MKKSEQLLLGGLATAVIGWFGSGLVMSKLMAPITDLRNQEVSLRKLADDGYQKKLAEMKKVKEFGDWVARSLPPNPNVASTVYTNWVDSLAKISGLEETKLKPQVPKPNNIYSSCAVELTAKGRLDELALFLERFESADLMHRIDQLKVDSPSNEGDPELSLTIVAEGLSMKGAPERTLLFPRTELYKAIPKDDTQLIVTNPAGFPPKAPFLVRIADEFVNVTEVKEGGVWTVQRGVEKSFAENHAANVFVELFRVMPRAADAGANVLAMRSRSPFIKPAPPFDKQPRLASTAVPTAVRGQTWTWNLKVADWNPAFGAPTYQLISGPPNMTIDKKTGRMQWRVGDQTELGESNVSVLVWGPNGDQANYSPQFKVRVREPNPAPTFTAAGPFKFFIGRQSSVRITAEDPAPNPTRLKYSLQNPQQGMEINDDTGEIRWRPPENMMPGELSVGVKVTDSDEQALVGETVKAFPVVLAEDSAQFAYLTAVVQSGDGPRTAWIRDRATDKSTTFKEGDQIQIADFNLKVVELGTTFVVFQRDEQFFRLDMDAPLVKMKPVQRPQPVSVPDAKPDPGAAQGGA